MIVQLMKPKSQANAIIDLKNIDGIWQLEYGCRCRTEVTQHKYDLSGGIHENGGKSCFLSSTSKKEFGSIQMQEYPI